MILDRIVAHKQLEVAALRARTSPDQLRARAERAAAPRDFVGALRSTGGVRLIAEVKRKSPSKGVFRAHLDAPQLARAYVANGAACISVLTDTEFFAGTLDDLRAVRAAVDVPLLRKDFIIDEAQIYEAREAGADAILLIAAILDEAQLLCFMQRAQQLGMAALIEIHDEDELRRVLPLHASLIGINNRDLKTFRTDLAVSERLRPLIPRECVVVGESGIHTRADVERLERVGVNAILVGESLVLAADVGAKVKELVE
ncbi:MAG: indole-3-glycerol phosphate synthase TrpC [Chloroflexi bacterium]|nr:indole-3-glycerol phosphate synthase TrpC [Chloroflexota bacterium]